MVVGLRFTGRNPVTVRPAKISASVDDNWARDRSAPGVDDGTEIDADWANRVKAMLSHLVQDLGGTLNDQDNSAAQAIKAFVAQQLAANQQSVMAAVATMFSDFRDGTGPQSLSAKIALHTYGPAFPAIRVAGKSHTFENGATYFFVGNAAGDVVPVQILGAVTDVPAIRITPNGGLYRLTVGQPVGGTYEAEGGTAPYEFTATGLPPGFSVALNGAQSGSPTTPGVYNALITATDDNNVAGLAAIAFEISPAVTLGPSSGSHPVPIGTVMNNIPFQGGGGRGPLVFTQTGMAALGLTLTEGGVIFGTVNGHGEFTVRCTDQNGAYAEQTYTYY